MRRQSGFDEYMLVEPKRPVTSSIVAGVIARYRDDLDAIVVNERVGIVDHLDVRRAAYASARTSGLMSQRATTLVWRMAAKPRCGARRPHAADPDAELRHHIAGSIWASSTSRSTLAKSVASAVALISAAARSKSAGVSTDNCRSAAVARPQKYE